MQISFDSSRDLPLFGREYCGAISLPDLLLGVYVCAVLCSLQIPISNVTASQIGIGLRFGVEVLC